MTAPEKTGSEKAESPEQLFQRFQRTGSPVDLAKVFDATAPQLLLLASHVSPDGGAAEDLLQETFLQAMEKAGQWDADRPLLPWLAGILRHRAQDLARKLRLRRPKAELSDVVVAAEGGGPLGEAESNELLQRVQDALDTLQSPFREALVLRLVHGLQPTEIAHALGRPPATVRGQLKRGLEALRGVLPASLASGLALLLLPGRGIAATRAAVLAATGREQVTAAGLGGGTRSTVWFVAAACAALLITVAAIWWSGGDVTVPPTGVANAQASNDPEAETEQPATETPSEVREQVPVVSTKADTTTRTTLRGRCVRATDGLPLAGGTATLSFGRGRFMTEDPDYRNWPDPIEVRAEADGRFAVEFEPQRLQRVFLEVTVPGHSESSEEWTSIRSGIDIDLGDIRLFPACRLQARVVDEQGVAVPDCWLSIDRRSGGVGNATFGMWSSMDLKSDAQGLLGEEILPAPGSYGISAMHDNKLFEVLRPTHIDLDASPVRTIDIVVRRTGAESSIRGHVVDDRGQAVAGLTICIDEEYPQFGQCVTGADGSFNLPLDYPKRPRKLYLPMLEQRFRMLDGDREYKVGQEGIQLRVARQRAFEVTVDVVDARTGKPVEYFGIAHELDYWTEERRFQIPPDRFYFPVEPTRHERGRAVLEVHPGQHRVQVWPQDGELATAYMVPFVVTDENVSLRIELQGHAEARLQLRDENGKPLAGVEARLTHSLGAGPKFLSMWSVEEFAMGRGCGNSTGVALQTLTTDAEGRAVFRAPIGDDRLGVQLRSPLVRWTRRPMGAVPAEGADWEITLPALARVHGTVGPARFLDRTGPSPAERLMDSMVREEDSDLRYGCVTIHLRKGDKRGGDAVVLPDGTFHIEAVVPGDYDVYLADDAIGDVKVGEVVALRAGEDRDLSIDASGHVPCELSASVFVDGEPWLRGEFALVSEKIDHNRVRLDTRGFGTALLRPGRYLPFVSWEDEDGQHKLFATERIQLSAGVDLNQAFVFETRKLRLQLQKADGTPAAKQLIHIRLPDHPEFRRYGTEWYKSDDKGVVHMECAPPGRFEVRLGRDGDVVGVIVPEAGPLTQRVLQLPE